MIGDTMKTSRRQLLKIGDGGGGGVHDCAAPCVGGPGVTPPSEKLNIAGIGAGGMGGGDIEQVARDSGTRIAALCDVDLRPTIANARRSPKFPDAKVYQDFRKMFDEMGDKIDARDRRHARPHARRRGDGRHQEKQARVLRKAPGPFRRGGPRPDEGGPGA